MNKDITQTRSHLLGLWLPLLAVVITGILFSIALVFSWLLPHANHSEGIAWLIAGLSLTFLIAVILYLARINRQHKLDLDIMTHHFKTEMTKRLTIEDTRKKLEKALLQGQKLQAIGTLAGGIAHDFNNVLYAIIGYVEMAREDSTPNTPLHTNLGRVIAAAKRGQDLVGRILAFSRRQHAELAPISMRATINGVLDLLMPTIPASVIIHFEADGTDCTILGNQTQLHQVFVNIITNAVDAMEGEGTITLTLHHVPPTDWLGKQLSLNENKHYCQVSIRDTGHGMDAPTLERIFEPFFTTKEVGRGTGLGLSTVHAIIRHHHGEILAESQPGEGTTFTLLLPEYDAQDSEETHYGKDSTS